MAMCPEPHLLGRRVQGSPTPSNPEKATPPSMGTALVGASPGPWPPRGAPLGHGCECRRRPLCTWDTLFFSSSLSGRRSTWLHFLNPACTCLKRTRDPRAWRSWCGRDEIQKIVQTSSIKYRFFNYGFIEYDISLEMLQGKAINFFSPMIDVCDSTPWTRSVRHAEGALSFRNPNEPTRVWQLGFFFYWRMCQTLTTVSFSLGVTKLCYCLPPHPRHEAFRVWT